MVNDKPEAKPRRSYFKTYIQLVKNSVGSEMFRNFYVSTPERGEFDALDDGENSCAFYVSSVLVLFKKAAGVHGTVRSTVEDITQSGWEKVVDPKEGDIIVWEAQNFDDGLKHHIGFYIGDDRAVSTSRSSKKVAEHHKNFNDNRKIEQIFRMVNWDD